MQIDGFGTKQYTGLGEFIKDWQPIYKWSYPERYIDHIDKALHERNSFNSLFHWKNGRPLYRQQHLSIDQYWEKKEVLIQLQLKFDWVLFESNFEPGKNACIWKVMLLHIVNPTVFPIYDQHVYRAFEFIQTGEIHEMPSRDKERYTHFKNSYNPWFQQIRKDHGFGAKFIDDACFAFGKALQRISKHPHQLYVES